MEMLTTEQILERFPPCLRENLLHIWADGKIGISAMKMKINLSPKKADYDFSIDSGNNFILEIPYAGRRLHWEVIFQDDDLTFAPDFDFVNEPFLCDPDIDTINNNIPSLAKWDVENSKSLINVIKEFICLYKKCQIQRLETEPRFSVLYTEYVLLKQELNIDEEDIEVYVDNNAIHFLIALKLDFSLLPVYIQKSYFKEHSTLLNPGEDNATLRVSFSGNRVTSYLQLSPRLEQVLGDNVALHIPPYNRDATMVEYIPAIYKLLEDKIEEIKRYSKMKEEYISVLLTLYGFSIIEYDNIDFSKAMLLHEVDNFYCLVHITLSNKFPLEKPSVVLRSLYHRCYGNVLSSCIDNYPYSPRWTPEEMVNRLMKHVHEEIIAFKKFCTSRNS